VDNSAYDTSGTLNLGAATVGDAGSLLGIAFAPTASQQLIAGNLTVGAT